MMNEDPFAIFGNDDDEFDDDGTDRSVAISLLNAANREQQRKAQDADPIGPVQLDVPWRVPNASNNDPVDNKVLMAPEELVLPWPSPFYIGPAKIASNLPFGGGRGLVATRDLEPGTLLLVEEPVTVWPEEQLGKELSLISVRSILQSPSAVMIVHAMEHLHPVKAAVDGFIESNPNLIQVFQMMDDLRSKHASDPELERSLQVAKDRGLVNSDGTSISSTDILRLLLALRYNGLESGLFLYMAMLNHSYVPNCVKFSQSHEVRTTRQVRAGEALTISYLPRILCYATRRWYLYDQHRFDIGVGGDDCPSAELRAMEMVHGQMPASECHHKDEKSATSRVESTLEELEDMHQDLSSLTTILPPGTSTVADRLQALEQASLELCRQTETELQNDRHLLLIPCLQLHVDCCVLMEKSAQLPSSQRDLLQLRLVVSALRLRDLLQIFQGADHYDMARTHWDLAQAVEALLAKSPQQLLSLRLPGLETVASWASLEHRAKKEYERIKALYPYDAPNPRIL